MSAALFAAGRQCALLCIRSDSDYVAFTTACTLLGSPRAVPAHDQRRQQHQQHQPIVDDETLTDGESPLAVDTSDDGITTLRFNQPKRLNGWTLDLMEAMKAAINAASSDENTRALVITGTGSKYYSAGANLAGNLQLIHPSLIRPTIRNHNEALFRPYITCIKPIVVAVNGRAIGAPVTSASLCDAVLAVEHASFETPFARLGLYPEGCSSVHFERLMGSEMAERMLGEEGARITATEALQVGLVDEIIKEPGDLMSRAMERARQLADSGKPRRLVSQGLVDEYLAVNEKESDDIARGMTSPEFLQTQRRFLQERGKTQGALLMGLLQLTYPVWSRWL